jgi:sirohydrochlorin ferrochelatase
MIAMAETSQALLPTTALLLIAHGSRHEEANDDLFHFAKELERLGRYGMVEASFLEIAPPDILEGGSRCVARGATAVILVPSFFSAGVHLRRDLKAACRELSTRYPQVRFTLAEPLGRHPLLTEILAARAREAEDRPDG